MRIFSNIASILILSVSMVATPALAKDGRVLSTEGGVTIQRGGETLIAKKDMLLQSGDTLSTDIDGRILWQMADEAIFVMPENASFELVEHEPSTGGTVYYRQESGGVRTHTGLVSGATGGNYKHETPTGNIEAKGTDYVAILITAAQAADMGLSAGLYVLVKSGAVALANVAGNLTVSNGEIALMADVNVKPEIVPAAPAILIALFISKKFDFDFLGLGGDIDVDILPPVGGGGGDPDPDPSPN